jgi:hypothetical protein
LDDRLPDRRETQILRLALAVAGDVLNARADMNLEEGRERQPGRGRQYQCQALPVGETATWGLIEKAASAVECLTCSLNTTSIEVSVRARSPGQDGAQLDLVGRRDPIDAVAL